MAIAKILEDRLVGAIYATPDERAAIIADARQAALALCDNEEDRRQVECRAIEWKLIAAGALGRNRLEVERMVDVVRQSPFFDEGRRTETISLGEAILNRMESE